MELGNCSKHYDYICVHTVTTQESPHLRAAPFKESVFGAADSNAVLRSWTQLPPLGRLISSCETCMQIISLTLGARMCNKGYSSCSVCQSVRLLPRFCHHAQQTGKIATPAGSALHCLYFQLGDFGKSAAFRSYGVKTK